MEKTVPAEFIGKENIGYALLALLSDSAKEQVTTLLSELDSELPDVLWLMPPKQLHITLCEIVQPKSYAQDKDTLYKLHEDEYENVPAQIFAALPAFTITFDTIEASPQAVIIKASDSSQLNSIRAKLAAEIPLPGETRTPPDIDITHSSIARYVQGIELKNVQEVVAKHRIQIEEKITEFQLVRSRVQPLQEYEVLRSYRLTTGE